MCSAQAGGGDERERRAITGEATDLPLSVTLRGEASTTNRHVRPVVTGASGFARRRGVTIGARPDHHFQDYEIGPLNLWALLPGTVTQLLPLSYHVLGMTSWVVLTYRRACSDERAEPWRGGGGTCGLVATMEHEEL
jgi:hypothetical protein